MPNSTDASPLLSLRGVEKSFGSVQALAACDLELQAGEILGLVGENGAGKSTLIKLISGVHSPSAGELTWNGKPTRFASPHDALRAGIATIHQELEYFPHLSVSENMLLGEPWPRRSWGGVHWGRMFAEAHNRLSSFGLDLSPGRLFGELTPAQKQEVAIASALSRNARLLILDEPTASLSEPEVKRLFAHLKRLQSAGVAMIYVSHRLDEIFAITDRVAVLRDGEMVATHNTAQVDAPRLVHDMVGRPLEQVYPRTRGAATTDTLLDVCELTRKDMFHDVSFEIRAGEIVGLGGLVGAGRSELARAIYGLYASDAGAMKLRGQPWRPQSPHRALRAGLVYLPEERKRQGLVLDHSLQESISIGFSDLLTRYGLIDGRKERAQLREVLEKFDIRASGLEQPVGTLSGGNQQKALLARWLERDPEIILLDEPTRGVDVGAKAQIHAIVDRLAAQGKAILFVSSDLSELVGMSDRILVMNRGTIEVELRGEDMTEQNVILAASGLYGSRAESGEARAESRETRSGSRGSIAESPKANVGKSEAQRLAAFGPPLSAARLFARSTPSVRHRMLFLVGGNLALLAFIFWRTLQSPNASFLDELSRLAPNAAPQVLAGLGLTAIICTGAIDLSIGAIVVVAGTVFGIGYEWGYSPIVCFAACYLAAVGLSAANGYLIQALAIPAIIVTLAGLVFYRGLALILADLSLADFGGQISVQGDAYHAPGKEYATAILLTAFLAALAWELFGKTPRTWLALGDSEEACRLKGLHPGKVLQSSFWASGLFLGLAAVTFVTNRLTIEPSRMARNFELDVIGGVVLGGTNIFGGEGSLLGTALGALFLYLVGQTLLYAGVGEYWRTAVQGAVIVAVIGFDCWVHRREKLLKELQ